MALDHGADALGFVSAMPSGPGPIDDSTIVSLIAALLANTNTVLLTSRSKPADVVAHVKQCKPTTVQIVDAVPVDTYTALRAETPDVKIIQVIHVQGSESLEGALAVSQHVDAVLLDSGTTTGAVKKLGGTGQTHDWSVSRSIVEALSVPVWLAGGLNADNVADAIAHVQPFGVDLCTGVRTDKKLDEEKLAVFMKAVHNSRA